MIRTFLALALSALLLGGCISEGPRPTAAANDDDNPTPVEQAHVQVNRWIKELDHTFGKDRLARLQALISYKELALEPIIQALPDANPEVRANLVYVLGYIGGAPAHQALIGNLNDEDPGVRYEAAAALVNLGDWSGVPILIDFMDSEDKRMRYKSFQILREKSKDDFGYRFAASPPEREMAVGKWRAWWKETRSSIIYGDQ